MSPIDQAALSSLRAKLSPSAYVSLPGEPKYSVKRWALNAEKPAAAVACPATPEDVAQILAFVQGKAPYESQKKLDLAIKGGGHTPSGASSTDGGLVIDLNPNMNSVRVDPEAKLAYVSGGALWGDVDAATIKHGLASVSGAVSHTGVGGLTLGGGYGWLCGQHGLVVDNVAQYTIVTSSGEILTVNSSSHPDLYWALRGGGGNFGVVTEFVLRVHDQRPDLYTSTLIYPPSLLEALVKQINLWLKDRKPEETVLLMCGSGPGGPSMIVQYVYNGPEEEGKQRIEGLVKLGPVMNLSKSIPYIQLNQMQDEATKHGENRLLQGNFVPATPDGIPVGLAQETFALWHKFITEHPIAARTTFAFELFDHRKWSSVPADATAFVHRSPTYNLLYLVHYTDSAFTPDAGPTLLALDKSFSQARDKYFPPELTGQGGYMNYLDEESKRGGSEYVNKRYGSNFKRLVEVKKQYDAGNLFGKWFAVPRA